MPEYTYRAIRVKQELDDRTLVLFSAPATEIDEWGGVPQKKELGPGTETTGFQREVNEKRLESIKAFFQEPRNVIQNPLLCATRSPNAESVRFVPDADEDADVGVAGNVVIKTDELENRSLLELLKMLKEELEERVEALGDQAVPQDRIIALKELAEIPLNDGEEDDVEHEDEDDELGDDETEEDSEDAVGSVFSDESHILDFWQEVAARVQILEELGGDFSDREFLGYSADALISFLRPVVVVDGQHRLRGAIEAAKEVARRDEYREEIESAVAAGSPPDDVQADIERRLSRSLPCSLLLTPDPAEHVFQFVVVNQKATPIGRALLGTIVATTLSNEELERVSNRLRDAGIALEQSRAVAFLSRHRESPFYGLVERGLAADKKGLLPWSVLVSLIKIFQELRGGRLFGERNDYANRWRRKHLDDSGVVANWSELGHASAYDYWRQSDGPWRDVFSAFWLAVRDKLAEKEDEQAWNYWGEGRESNLFNKISLTILEADFFQFLCEARQTIDSADHVTELVSEWLDEVSDNYFNRDWKLARSVEESDVVTRNRAWHWSQYRKDPVDLPSARLLRPTGKYSSIRYQYA